MEERASRALLERVPQGVGPSQERDVVRMLEIGGTDHARLAVGAATAMAERKLLEPQHAKPAGRQLLIISLG